MQRILSLFVCLLLASASADHALAQQRLIVFAAASLKEALDEVNGAYQQTKGVAIVASYAGSGALIKQIEQGAPADVFISADPESMEYGSRKKVVQDNTHTALLGNKLVLIAPGTAKVERVTVGPDFPLAAMAGDSRIVTGDVRAVPVGRYAQAALRKLGLWQAAQPKLAMVENVRVALALVAREEALLGIVYETDARAEPRVRVTGVFPPDSHPPIVYPAALTATAKPGAAAYLEFLQSPAARRAFEKRGFTFLARTS
jgi:molybdate transport system substrate-binding protein